MSLSVIPVRSYPKMGVFDLFESLRSDLKNNGLAPQNGDIFVISSKYVANSQGRVIEYEGIYISPCAHSVASKFHIRPEMAEIIVRESDIILGGIPGFTITSSDNIVAPNAGIDKSNAKKGSVILYPTDPYYVSEQLRRKFVLSCHAQVGIIIADSRLMPARTGTVGVAIACAGIEPIADLRGHVDLFGNPLKVTFQAIADNIASIANMSMGEGADCIPSVLVRDSGVSITDRKISKDEMAISYEQCVYVRGLRSRI